MQRPRGVQEKQCGSGEQQREGRDLGAAPGPGTRHSVPVVRRGRQQHAWVEGPQNEAFGTLECVPRLQEQLSGLPDVGGRRTRGVAATQEVACANQLLVAVVTVSLIDPRMLLDDLHVERLEVVHRDQRVASVRCEPFLHALERVALWPRT